MSLYTIACPCLFGLESVLSGEIKRMGAQEIETVDGKVTFKGDAAMIAKANIHLRTAERVLLVLGKFRAQSFTELFDGVAAINFEDYLASTDTFPVKGWSINSKLHSIPDCQSIIKKAIVKRMSSVYHREWFEETGPLHQVQFSILKDEVTIMLDTSGAGLHKRGYRPAANAAPIKETLAAGIIDLARVKADTVVFDPFCGSGTILIESALKALRVPPGLKRRFAAEQWGLVPRSIWEEERTAGIASVVKEGKFKGYGFDIDPEAIELSRVNAAKAGVASRLLLKQQDIAKFKLPEENFTLITNPPYGERLLEVKQAEELYRQMGKIFEPGEGRSYYIISPHEEFESIFGRKANKRRKLYNGMIKCQLYMYF